MSMSRYFVSAMIAVAFLVTSCGGNDKLLGDIAPVKSGQSVDAASETAQPETAQPDPTQPGPTPAAIPPPTPVPVETIDFESNDNVGIHDGVEFTIASTRGTNTAPSSLILDEAEPAATDIHTLVVEVDLSNTSSAGTDFFPQEFRLVSAAGESSQATAILDDRGDTQVPIEVGNRETDHAFIVFELGELPGDLSGWHFGVDRNDRAPSMVPIVGEYERLYPIELRTGLTGQLAHAEEACRSLAAGSGIDTEVVRAVVTDEPWSPEVQRPDRFERYLVLEFYGRNSYEVSGSLDGCFGSDQYLSNYPLAVSVDGRRTNGSLFRDGQDRLHAQEEGTMHVTFIVPTDAKRVEIISVSDDAVLAGWDVTLPPLPFE